MNRTLVTVLFAFCLAHADQGSFTNSGGSGSAGSGVIVTSSPTTPSGTLSLSCPGTGINTCAGGSYSYTSTDGTTSVNANFTSGTFAEGCSGGGKGGNVTCSYTFSGQFSGTLTVNGAAQAITGATSQAFGTGGAAARGTSIYNSAYTPFYYSDSEQIHRSDDLLGTNQISYGSQGGGVGQFYGAYGIALDSAGRIYIADTYNCRVVRIDDMNGTNWTSYGTCGSGAGQFYDPSGIALDSAGRIYVMDAGNCRVVRMDNMSGANFAAYGSVGSGTGQFSQWLQSIAVDSSARIYVADTGNKRLVRMDDLNGTNWTALTQSVPISGATYSFQSPVAVTLDAAGKIYVADNESYQPAVIRMDDMTGANWTWIWMGANSGGLNSLSVDSSGTVFAGGGGAKLVVNMAGVLASSGAIGPIGSYYVFGVTPVRLPTPRPSAIGFSPSTLSISQNVGTSSAPQNIVVSNFGGTPLSIGTISASG
ncbi:MAG TPA: NHL repeat-containing protein, partial [Candidatus Sulfopaludibacter sp.]|nr:NHL repeat-containing protein [Candidatus Sulfopaludibacter sp.]